MRSLALWIVGAVASPDIRNHVVGDLIEESRQHDLPWLWRQVLWSFLPLFAVRVRSQGLGLLKLAGIVLGSYLVLTVPIVALHAVAPNVTPLQSLAVDLPVAAMAGFVVVLLGRQWGKACANLFAGWLCAMSMLSLYMNWGAEPRWYQVVLAMSLVSSVLVGAQVARRQTSK
ncbi:MAG: hypothetical protein JNL98_04495 [Bryobacterales bacterium]|nr:hypothetical protein [Bryobacterales bacterium]